MEVTPELLPYALRNLYARAVTAGLSANPLSYRFCSSRLHFADSVPSWFETREFLERVARRGHVGQASVESFLGKAESQRHADMFARLSSRIPQIAGESVDIEDAIGRVKQLPAVPSIEWITEKVAAILRQKSLPLDGVLAIAMASWYATRAGAATLADMGRWFDREPTTLRADIESHRRRNPMLFESDLDELLSLLRAPDTVKLTPDLSNRPPAGSRARPSKSGLAAEELITPPSPQQDAAEKPRAAALPSARSGSPSICRISNHESSCLESDGDRDAPPSPRRRRKRSVND